MCEGWLWHVAHLIDNGVSDFGPEASMLKTETGDVSTNINSETLTQLPLMGVGAAASGSSGIRNPNNVLNVVPGTYYVPNSQVKINGAPSNTQTYHVEGQDTTNQGYPYAPAQVQQGVDALQEVSVPKGFIELKTALFGVVHIPFPKLPQYTVQPFHGVLREVPGISLPVQVLDNLTLAVPFQRITSFRRDPMGGTTTVSFGNAEGAVQATLLNLGNNSGRRYGGKGWLRGWLVGTVRNRSDNY